MRRIRATFTKKTRTLMIHTGRFQFFFITPTLKKIAYLDFIVYQGRQWQIGMYRSPTKGARLYGFLKVREQLHIEIKIPLEVL